MLDRLATVGLKIKLTKCSFMQNEVKYLRHIVTSEGIQPNPVKIETIQDHPIPDS